MQQYVDLFITAREAEGCTIPTLRWHRSCLKRFTEWCDAQSLTDPDALTPHLVRTFIVTLQQSNLNPTSVATYVRSLRAFLGFLFTEELMEKNIAAKVKEPKTPRTIKRPLEDAELKGIINACLTTRDKAIVTLLFDTGIRASELCTLTRNKVLLDQRLIIVMGKGQKMRAVPFSVGTSIHLRKYLLEHDHEYVFLGRSGNPLTPNGLLQMMKRLAKRADIENVHPHLLRHTFATNFLRAGGSTLQLQRILGHETPAMTAHYVNMSTTDLQEAHDAASPLTRLLRKK